MLNPPIKPIDLSGGYVDVSALLTILADPATHKARLDELIAAETGAKEQIAALNEMAADTRRKNTAAQAANIISDKRKTALDAREAELDERAKNLEQSEATKSDAALRRREAACTAQEGANQREANRLAALRTDLEGKHNKIKHLAGNL